MSTESIDSVTIEVPHGPSKQQFANFFKLHTTKDGVTLPFGISLHSSLLPEHLIGGVVCDQKAMTEYGGLSGEWFRCHTRSQPKIEVLDLHTPMNMVTTAHYLYDSFRGFDLIGKSPDMFIRYVPKVLTIGLMVTNIRGFDELKLILRTVKMRKLDIDAALRGEV